MNTQEADRFLSVTELSQDEVAPEQVHRMCQRYYWAGPYCQGKDVVEVACGTGQGLGYLQALSRSLVGGDISPAILDQARAHYGDRVELKEFAADAMPFEDNSKDVVVLFEAIYYLPNVSRFLDECRRVLRPGGWVLIATANKDLYDFNPSPFSNEYLGVKELEATFADHGFAARCYGDTPVDSVSVRQRVLRPVKSMAVKWNLIPQTMNGKKWLKKMVFGGLVPMPAEVKADTAPAGQPTALLSGQPDTKHKVLYCAAQLEAPNA